MKKVFTLKGLDCPHCSAEIEREAGRMEGVSYSGVNLMNRTLTLEIDEAYTNGLFGKIEEIVHNHEPEVTVSENAEETDSEEESEARREIIKICAGAAVYVIGMILTYALKLPKYAELAILITAYIILGSDAVIKACKNIMKGRVFDENFLMTVSTIGAFVIGEYPEAVAVMLFYKIGELFEDLAVDNSRRSITALMDIRPDSANVMRGGRLQTVSPSEVHKGETIVVKPGERIPLDGIVTNGKSTLDTSALTGESAPRSVTKGDTALSGCVNAEGSLTIEVTKEHGESTASKIISMVENAASKKAPTESFITSFSRYYTPAVVIMAVILGVLPPLILGGGWAEWIRRGFVFLVISCPCALVISIPLTFFGGIGAASKKGVLIKGGNYLEALNSLDTVVFDKTGTLTKGIFTVSEVFPANDFTEAEVLLYAAKAESFSNHPIARSVITACGEDVNNASLSDCRELPGKGVCVKEDGKTIIAGNEKAMKAFGINAAPCAGAGTKVYVSYDGEYAGCILISDELKPDSKEAIAGLKKLGIKKTVMLTGDDKAIADFVAKETGIDEYRAELLPDGKAAELERIISMSGSKAKTAFVGDGINDAPALARADIGIAMGALGQDAAIEAADIVLMTDEPSRLTDAVKTAGFTKRIAVQNIVFALGIKAVFLILGALGIAGMWLAVFGDVGVMIIAVLNSMRALRVNNH